MAAQTHSDPIAAKATRCNHKERKKIGITAEAQRHGGHRE